MATSDSVIPRVLTAEMRELALLRELSGELQVPVPVPAAAAVAAAAAPPPPPAAAAAASPLSAAAAPPAAPPAPPAPPPYASEREVRRLEAIAREYSETNERIMAQNIALLADLEAAQRTVRELRAGKDALAVQLRRCRDALAEKDRGEAAR